MNTVEMNAPAVRLSAADAANVVDLQNRQSNQRAPSADRYSATGSHESVAAKVLSFSVGKGIEGATQSQSGNLALKLQEPEIDSKPMEFDIDLVRKNVIGFVTQSLNEFANNGASEEQLQSFRQQAIEGITLGVENAKKELGNYISEPLEELINSKQAQMIEEVKAIPLNAVFASQNTSSTEQDAQTSSFFMRIPSGAQVDIELGARVFNEEQGKASDLEIYTTQASNLSFNISGAVSTTERRDLADLINEVDAVIDTFYRQNIESSYSSALALGYENEQFVKMASTSENSVSNAYENVRLMGTLERGQAVEAPKLVSAYVAKLMDMSANIEQKLASQEDYQDIINGLVNQMKDVQVPDLVQAINRFHKFNAKFI
ncbi:DUF5610 domain-containing protein [Ningiella sp. W23]|uniref:DUF5610 domain-containing protein n=1 Tax=Ningiella sp. W23 TaxID=3023715 RepID=UPI00375812F3